jgi:hypothetical protein
VRAIAGGRKVFTSNLGGDYTADQAAELAGVLAAAASLARGQGTPATIATANVADLGQMIKDKNKTVESITPSADDLQNVAALSAAVNKETSENNANAKN